MCVNVALESPAGVVTTFYNIIGAESLSTRSHALSTVAGDPERARRLSASLAPTLKKFSSTERVNGRFVSSQTSGTNDRSRTSSLKPASGRNSTAARRGRTGSTCWLHFRAFATGRSMKALRREESSTTSKAFTPPWECQWLAPLRKRCSLQICVLTRFIIQPRRAGENEAAADLFRAVIKDSRQQPGAAQSCPLAFVQSKISFMAFGFGGELSLI